VIREQLAQHIAPENLPTGDRPQYRKAEAPAKPAPEPRQARGDRRAPARPPAAEAQAKITYKAGWAKPKGPRAARRPGPRKPPT
jgi:23S rRNA pseudouridine2605 synthase